MTKIPRSPDQAAKAERLRAVYASPFKPQDPQGQHLDMQMMIRATHALEYIAAAMGQINEKLDAIVKRDGG